MKNNTPTTLICKKCFNSIKVNININPKLSIIEHDSSMYKSVPINDDQISIDTNIKCPFCNNDEMFECDDELVQPIIELNKLGFETIFCCQGHNKINLDDNDDLDYRLAYIYFDNITMDKLNLIYNIMNEYKEGLNDEYQNISREKVINIIQFEIYDHDYNNDSLGLILRQTTNYTIDDFLYKKNIFIKGIIYLIKRIKSIYNARKDI